MTRDVSLTSQIHTIPDTNNHHERVAESYFTSLVYKYSCGADAIYYKQEFSGNNLKTKQG
jgi:hypothetical protein